MLLEIVKENILNNLKDPKTTSDLDTEMIVVFVRVKRYMMDLNLNNLKTCVPT